MEIYRPDPPHRRSRPTPDFEQVAALIREGRLQEARLRALAIESPHVRDMAFVLIERSKPLVA